MSLTALDYSRAYDAKKTDIMTMAKILCRSISAVGPDCHCGGSAGTCRAVIVYARVAAELQAALVKTGRLHYEDVA